MYGSQNALIINSTEALYQRIRVVEVDRRISEESLGNVGSDSLQFLTGRR